MHRARLARRKLRLAVTALMLLAACASQALATRIVLNDGRVLQGDVGVTPGVAEPPLALTAGEKPVALIRFVDDGLRRTFFSQRHVREVLEDEAGETPEVFRLPQRVSETGTRVHAIGPAVDAGPFDSFGRRLLTVETRARPLNVIQAITEVAPRYIRAQGTNFTWDMRLATSNYSREFLNALVSRQIAPTSIEDRKRLVRFYLQCDRYEDAADEIDGILEDFEGDAAIAESLEPTLRTIRQLAARRLLDELEMRKEAGQHAFVYEKLTTFPTEGVAGEILQAVRGMIGEYDAIRVHRDQVLQMLTDLTDDVADDEQRARCQAILEEMAVRISPLTISRLDAYGQFADDPTTPAEEKLALAISGWVVGPNAATDQLSVALSLYATRALIREYLVARTPEERAAVFEELKKQEAATCHYATRILALAHPPETTPGLNDKPRAEDAPSGEEADSEEIEQPGYFEIEVPSYGNLPPYRYLVQLPPEYNPDMIYPTIVTLNGASSSPAMQIDWWAGSWVDDQWRAGQASRYGYIVIAPVWAEKGQTDYGYSAREHGAVLYCLRDAFRRFAVDTDRVFLSGHSMGGDAAWDIGLAHPDLWAGVIPISATADRFVTRYWENARYVPLYLVLGEVDNDRMATNAVDLDRYLIRGFDTTVVEFIGRGHEHFYDEIHRLFDWMARRRRDFYPKEFEVVAMRPWDCFYWWVEVDGMPPMTMVDPMDWPPARTAGPAVTSGKINPSNGIYVKSAGARVAVWLSPRVLDLEQRVKVTVDGKKISPPNGLVEGDLATLLEDARQRSDRQNVFWLKLVR